MRSPLPACALVAVVALSACVGPSRTSADYRSKAANTAEAAASAAQTAVVAIRAQRAGKAPATYLSVVLGQAEESVTTTQGQFDSVQPPNERADEVRDQIDSLLTQLVAVLADLRIAVRRGELDRLADISRPLPGLVERLQRFEAANS